MRACVRACVGGCGCGWVLILFFSWLCRYVTDIVVGNIYFLLVRITIKHMEIAIIKKETSGSRE